MSKLSDLFDRHAAASWDKQQALAALVGKHSWQLDSENGVITFNERLKFPVQILGTESDVSNSWLWAWANKVSPLPATLLASANELRALGEREGIAELTQAQISRDKVNGHYLSLLASGVCKADCYYRGPYDNGAVLVLITAPQVRQSMDNSPAHLASMFSQVISNFELDHRSALRSYLQFKGYAVNETPTGIAGKSSGGRALKATFDGAGRLAELEAQG
jgi:uncharacterized protein DUF6882